MAIIYTYGYDSNINGADALIGTDSAGRKTKQFRVSDLTDYISDNISVVKTITTTNSTFISLTPSTPQNGDVVITSTLSASGTADETTYLRGDNTWATIEAIGGTVTSVNTNDSTFISGSGGPITDSGSLTYSLSASGTPSESTYLRGDNTWATITSSEDNYVDSISFNTGTGDLTLGRTGVLPDLVQSLDGRYALTGGGGITGSGTSNYLAVWQDVDEIGDGFLQSEIDGVDYGALYFGPDVNTGVGIVFGKEVGSEQIRFGINNNSKLGINTDGSFADNLTVNEINITDGILATDGDSGLAGQVLYKPTANTLKWVDLGSIYLVPTLVTGTPGGSLNLTDADYFLYITWSGGSGVFDINLPIASGVPFKNIRFVCDGTVTASDKVHVNAVGGDTIDGGAFYEMNKPYNGVQVWSDGTQWMVIQAKST